MAKVKICGITKIEDAILAAELGVWAIGFIFYSKSPRYITPEDVQKISEKMKKYGVKTIGVFVNELPETITHIAKIAELDYVQLHGFESVDDCIKLSIPYIKNIRTLEETKRYTNAFAFLVDAADVASWGGTGVLADWNLAKNIKAQGKSLMLSGGLSPNNIEKALIEVNPEYIDISSSLEISAGIKNPSLMKEFFAKIKNKEIEINE